MISDAPEVTELDPTVAPLARFVRFPSDDSAGCLGPLVFVVVAGFILPVNIYASWAVAAFGILLALTAKRRRRKVEVPPSFDLRVYPDAIGLTRDGSPWKLVRFDATTRIRWIDWGALELAQRDGDAFNLPVYPLTQREREELFAILATVDASFVPPSS